MSYNKNNLNYGKPGCKDAVWKKAKKINEKDPSEYRKCAITGNEIRYSHYGDNSSIYNWDIDHIISKVCNGSDHIFNLHAVNSSKNRSMGNSMAEKPKAVKLMFENMRIKRNIEENKKTNFKWEKSIIGKTFLIKPSPITIPQRGIIKSYNKNFVFVFWEDAKYETRLPLDKHLFEIIPEGRPKRIHI